jgi:hypothetical protein
VDGEDAAINDCCHWQEIKNVIVERPDTRVPAAMHGFSMKTMHLIHEAALVISTEEEKLAAVAQFEGSEIGERFD